jgi:hypothetical protein
MARCDVPNEHLAGDALELRTWGPKPADCV